MKVNLGIEIDDASRNTLACMITGKSTKRLATRDEVRDFVVGTIASLAVGAQDSPPSPVTNAESAAQSFAPTAGENLRKSLLVIDEEDAEVLAGKEESYIIGWNRFKRRSKG